MNIRKQYNVYIRIFKVRSYIFLFSSTSAPCLPGWYSPSGYDACLPCQRGSYSDREQATGCLTCPDHLTTLGTNSGGIGDCSIREYNLATH